VIPQTKKQIHRAVRGVVDLTHLLKAGTNILRITLWNIEFEGGAVSLSLTVKQGEHILLSESINNSDSLAGFRYDQSVRILHVP